MARHALNLLDRSNWKEREDGRFEYVNLTVLYESLMPEMKAEVDRPIQHPTVNAHWEESGQKKSLSRLPIEQLMKIKRGEIVANPVHEKPRSWRDAR